jgi:translation initiation factor 4G
LDFPKATSILGNFVGSAVLQTIIGLDALPQLLEGDYSVEPKREFAAAVFKRIKSQAGEEGLSEMCVKAEVHAASFLTADTADGDVESVEAFLKKEGLTCIPK